MRKVFADTFYWVALLNSSDVWHQEVRDFSKFLAHTRMITTDEVLTETLNFFSSFRLEMRKGASRLVRMIIADSTIQVIPQTRESFLAALALYEQRPDKEYSLTDCISMYTMRQLELTEVLTHDQHFTQEGFIVLLRK
ncbi:MAG: type II toxin-antitoxin system VapC family toxin [Stigonema ocellatum SAG 48.90 = DSM 106950]|nr:type II toxin-antitoxin system VapC family toxin [Stigonema ocellatum SAG 48.90 = DSM 106950]